MGSFDMTGDDLYGANFEALQSVDVRTADASTIVDISKLKIDNELPKDELR